MKKRITKILPLLLTIVVVISVLLIGIVYFNFISDKIYNDSTNNLTEMYGQVNRTFNNFARRNWALLDSWDDYISLADSAGGVSVPDFIREEQEYCGFSEFYFISEDESCMTLDGARDSIDLSKVRSDLFERNEYVMAGETLSSGQEVTFFAVPVERGSYDGFSFSAIAVSYTNSDIVRALNLNAFSGEGKCFVIYNDGSVLLSTQEGGNIFENYLTYLRTTSDLGEAGLGKMEQDWKNGNAGLTQCRINGVNNYILYQPVGYEDYVLLSVVPENAVNAGFMSIQRTTMVAIIVIFLLIGAVIFIFIAVRNSKTARKNRMELQYREHMFDVLSNSVDDIFLMFNTETFGVDYISPNVERLLGITAEEVRVSIRAMEKCVVNFDVVIPKEKLAAIPLNGSISQECEYMHQTTGERRWYRMTVYHMNIQDAEKYIVVLSDRTVDQQMNQKLEEALTVARNANEAKSNFLSNMSHDIRTPMNAIVGFSVLLEKDADYPDKVREYTRKITASSHHLLSLINDVLDMSKIESGKTSLNMDNFRLPELLDELNTILLPQAKAKRQKFEIHVQGAPPEALVGDKLRLNQILINMLSNAIKYTPDEGNIELEVREISRTPNQYSTLRFTVKDDGIGMSEEFQKNIFAPFSREISSVTNKIQGTGLGMAITKNLVDLMGGIIQVESAPGKGSTFTVELTFTLAEEENAKAEYRRGITRMLVADDEEEICLDIKEMMRDTDVSVDYATDGAAAVKMAVEAHERGESFHVILLDWKMPGLNGVETARLIREQVGSEVPILVLTSYDWSEIEEEAREAGIDAFMPKPFFASTFWQTIEPLFFDKTAQEEESAGEAEEGVLSGMLFLVAEDNELNAEILIEMLKMEEASCELAVNGKEAVEMFTASEPGHYDMVLMDVQMPVMNGYDATKAIRASSHPEAKTIPIVAMTANTFAEDVRDAFKSGMNGHLAKPIDMVAVRELIGRLKSKEGGNDK